LKGRFVPPTWEEFLVYLNEVSGTNDFDDAGKFEGNQTAVAVGDNVGVQIISDILWKQVYTNPAFKKPHPGAPRAVGNMMEKEGWYLESTIFDDSREVDPYIFYAITQHPSTPLYTPSLYAIWFTYDKDQIKKAISGVNPASTLVVQKWQLVYQTYEMDDAGIWHEETDDPDEADESGWADPGYSYIFSPNPMIGARNPGNIINFPYNILFEV